MCKFRTVARLGRELSLLSSSLSEWLHGLIQSEIPNWCSCTPVIPAGLCDSQHQCDTIDKCNAIHYINTIYFDKSYARYTTKSFNSRIQWGLILYNALWFQKCSAMQFFRRCTHRSCLIIPPGSECWIPNVSLLTCTSESLRQMIAADKKIELYKVCHLCHMSQNLACKKEKTTSLYIISCLLLHKFHWLGLFFMIARTIQKMLGKLHKCWPGGNPGLGESKVAPVSKWRPRRLTRSPWPAHTPV